MAFRKVDLVKLKRLRKLAGYTQAFVAQKLGYESPLGYHYIESGRCKLKAEQAVILAKLFNIQIDALFFDNEITAMVNEGE